MCNFQGHVWLTCWPIVPAEVVLKECTGSIATGEVRTFEFFPDSVPKFLCPLVSSRSKWGCWIDSLEFWSPPSEDYFRPLTLSLEELEKPWVQFCDAFWLIRKVPVVSAPVVSAVLKGQLCLFIFPPLDPVLAWVSPMMSSSKTVAPGGSLWSLLPPRHRSGPRISLGGLG